MVTQRPEPIVQRVMTGTSTFERVTMVLDTLPHLEKGLVKRASMLEDRLEYSSVMQASARVCYPRVTQHGKIDEHLHLIIWGG